MLQREMSERNFRTTDLISVLLLYVYVADSFKITVTKGKIVVILLIWFGTLSNAHNDIMIWNTFIK